MAENWQDNVFYGNSSLGMSGEAVSISGVAAGAKSVIFGTGANAGHLAWLPTANRTINLPDSGGTLQLTGGQAFSADASSTFQTLTLQNSNGISFSNNAGALRLTHDLQFTSNTSNIPRLTVSDSATSLTVSRLALTNSNNFTMTLSTGAGAATLIASYSQTNQSAIKALGASNTGNTAGNTGVSTGIDWVLAGTGAVTVSESTVGGGPNTLWFSAPNAAAGNVTFSAGANSSGLGSVIFANSNGVTFGLTTGSQITASVAGGGGIGAGVSNLGNTAGSTGTITTGNMVLVGSGAITLSQSTGAAGSNATVTITVPATSSLVGANGVEVSTNGSTITVRQEFQTYFAKDQNMAGSQTMTMLQSTSGMFPFLLPYPLSVDFLRLVESGSVLAASSTAATTGNSQFSGGHTRSHNIVIYSRGTGASSMSLQSVTSTQVTERYSINVSAAANSTQFSYSLRYTFPHASGSVGFTKDYSSSAASLNFHTSNVTDLTGLKVIDIPLGITLDPGQYWLGYGISSSTASQFNAGVTRAGIAFTHFGISQINSAFGTLGAATNSSVMVLPAHGSYSVAGGGTSASIDMTRISTSASQNMLYFQMMRIA